MEWITDGLSDLNYWVVLGAGMASMILGYLWYSDMLFAKKWRQLVGVKAETASYKGMAPMLVQSYILSLVGQSVLLAVMIASGVTEMGDAIGLAVILGLGFNFTTIAVNNLYQKKPFTLTLIDGAYQILTLVAGSVVFILWG